MPKRNKMTVPRNLVLEYDVTVRLKDKEEFMLSFFFGLIFIIDDLMLQKNK